MTTLMERAAASVKRHTEDKDGSSGRDVTVTNPSGAFEPLVGITTDIALAVDPDTGVAVTGRAASVSLVISTVVLALGSIPVGVSDGAVKPWLVSWLDLAGVLHRFKVAATAPDHALDTVICFLEVYSD